MPYSRCGSYRKDICCYDEYIAIQYELNKLRVESLHLNIRGYGILLLTKQFISYRLIKQFAYP